jgi:hypothetical protein
MGLIKAMACYRRPCTGMVMVDVQRVAGMGNTAFVFVYMGSMAGLYGRAGIVDVGMTMGRIDRRAATDRVYMRTARHYNRAGYTFHAVPVPVINACFVAIPVHVLPVMMAVTGMHIVVIHGFIPPLLRCIFYLLHNTCRAEKCLMLLKTGIDKYYNFQ